MPTKRPIIKYRPSNVWATTGEVIGAIPLRREFSFVRDTDGCIDAPKCCPAGATVKNVVEPDDRRRRPVHAIIPAIVWLVDR